MRGRCRIMKLESPVVGSLENRTSLCSSSTCSCRVSMKPAPPISCLE